MTERGRPFVIRRRRFIQGTAATLVLAGCGGSDSGDGGASAMDAGAPAETFAEPSKKLSGELKILVWSHFVPRHDKWFDRFAQEWGRKVGVNVTVDHIEVTTIPARLESEISARSGHDLVSFIGPLPQLEPSVIDLADVTKEAEQRFGKQIDLCRRSSLNPTTNKYYAYSPGWVPDPGNYRKSMWTEAGLPDGPPSWEQLRTGGAEIKSKRKVPVGIGMSQEIDSNMAGRALLWSYGGAIPDEQEQVVLHSPQTVAAGTDIKGVFEDAMNNEVFAWNPASNNQALVAGKLSYIVNSISAYRTMQQVNPKVAEDVFFVPALKGPKEATAAQHVMYNWLVPEHAGNADAAQEFLLHYTANFARATWESELYDFPAFDKLVPQLPGWLDDDPFGSKPSNKLSVLKDALNWTTNVGHRGYANTAIGEVFGTFIIPNMYARAARGRSSPQAAVARAEGQIKPIFEKWREK